jgi:hypothetical protein
MIEKEELSEKVTPFHQSTETLICELEETHPTVNKYQFKRSREKVEKRL